MASSSLSSGLVQASISPADGRLVFSLPAAGAAASASASASSSACACALTITNTSTTTTGGPCLAFKIKTTKPRRYLVRPCQGVLRPGEKQEVSILVPPERLGEVLRALEAGEEDDASSSDKFQVLYAGMDEATYWVVAGRGGEGNDGQQQQRLDRVWAQLDKRVIRERRLDVEFSSRASQHQQRLSSASSALSGFASSGPMTMAESRKRYDDLVTVTVALTAERDTLLNALDTLKFELRRELASQGERGQHVAAGGTVKQDQLSLHKRRRSKASSAAFMSSIPGIAAHARNPSSGLSMGPTGAGGRYHGDGRQHHAPEQRRFSTKAVAVAAILAFLIARWL